MTPDEARRAWYQEMAELFSPVTLVDLEQILDPIQTAKLAGHFGRLAMGRVARVDWDEHEDNQRTWRANQNVVYVGPRIDRELSEFGCDGSERCACEACSVQRSIDHEAKP